MGKTYNTNTTIKNGKKEWNTRPHSSRKRVRKMENKYTNTVEDLVNTLDNADEKDKDIISNASFNSHTLLSIAILAIIWIFKYFNGFTFCILVFLFLFSNYYAATYAFTSTKRRYKR